MYKKDDYRNAIVKTKTGEELKVRIKINNWEDWDTPKSKLYHERLTSIEKQESGANPINMQEIIFNIDGTDYKFRLV